MTDVVRDGSVAGSYGSRRGLVQRRRGGSSVETDRSGQQMYQPGTPIGYLAARGTPYEKKYFSKKLGFCCLFIAPPVIIVTLVITLVPVLWAIARHALHTSQLHVYDSNITSPGNSSFPLTIEGQVKKTGIFPAHLTFRKPVYVYWNTPPPNMRELQLGHFNLATIGAAAGHARVKQATTFHIDDEEGFGTFAKWLISMPEFTWRLRCEEVHAEAFSFFPTYKSLQFVKDVVFNGINGFSDVKILDLQLPGDDPAGGIQAIALTSLTNPSPFGVEVGTLNLALYYKNLYLGPIQATGLNLTTGVNTIKLFGRVVPYSNDQPALEILGELFTNYINSVTSMVEARGVSTVQADGSVVAWLAEGITALTVQIPFVPPKPIDPIKGIVIDYISLVYNTETPYNPVLFSNALQGTLALPFGFSLNVIDLATQLNIYSHGALVGSVYGDYGNSSTTITTRNEGETAGNISLTLPPSQLVLPNKTDAAKQQLVLFQDAFTYSDSAGFTTQGSAKAISDTPVGRILLNGINFNVTTGLVGLAGLTRYPTIINSVDVTGGAPDAVSLTVGTTVVNPSNLNLSTGDTTFQLINNVALGNVTLPNLNLQPGRNDIDATSFFDPNRAAIGIETLNRFISGLDTQLNISGFGQSTPIASLEPTLAGIRLNSTLPGLRQKLVQAANLTVLDTTGITDDIADSHVELYNPFTAGLTITRISANASSHGIFIANIDTPLQFTASGKAVTTSPVVPLSLNLYPPDLFALVRALAVQAGENPAFIDGIVNLGGYTLSPTTSQNGGTATRRKRDVEDAEREFSTEESYVFEEDSDLSQILMGVGSNPGMLTDSQGAPEEDIIEIENDGVAKRAQPLAYEGAGDLTKRAQNLYTGFDLPTYIGKAFAVATADLTIVSDAVIGQYGTTLTFSQNDVPLGTDATLFKLLPVLALPIVQKIVDGSVLNIDRVTITEANPNSFTAQLEGALTNAGPFDGTVTFPDGLTIYWEGQALTSTAFPNIALVADVGSSINVQVQGQIPDVDYFTNFLKYAIVNPTFIWNIRGSGISVAALGITVPNVTINKDVQLTGLNGLKGQVIINSFDVPYNDPAGGLHLTAVSTINNPAQVGVALTSFGTNIFMGSTEVGPAAAAQAFTLQALAVTTVPLAGRIQQQTTTQGLADLSEIFTRFVHNQNTNLLVNGVYAGPSDVAWLNNGIKALSVVVALPAQDFQVIRLVSINQLSLFFTVPTAYSPNTDSSNTVAHFFLPFAFPVDITQITGPFNARYNNQQMAVLNIPPSPATTDVETRVLTLMFQNVPFSVFGDAHTTFSNFVADVTREEQVTFNLNGMATSTTNTAAGVLTIQDIPFDLNTNILGLQNLNARPANVSDLDVVHGYPTYLKITVMTTLYNPSDITIGAGDVAFAVLFQNNLIGKAIIDNILLVPGENTVPTEIDYMPMGAQNVASGQLLLENYVQNVTSDTTVAGTSQTTPIESLQKALGGISLTASIPPLEKLIVVEAALEVPKDIAENGGVASASVMIANPFTAGIHILNLQADANFEGITIGTINQNLAATNNIVNAPGKQTTTSQQIPINLNIDPKVLIRFIEAAAAAYGVSLGPLPPYFQMVLDLADTTTTIMPYPDDSTPPCNSGRAFDTLGAILALLKPLATSIPIKSTLKLDDYQTDLDFIQQPVPTKTDNTALYLVGPAGAPLIQLIVNASTLTITQANATSLTNAGFTAALAGSLAVNSPADAYIEFPDPIIINWQGTDIAEIALPPLCSEVPDGIPNLMTTGQLTIINEGGFEDFTYYLLTQPNFQWTLHSNSVVVRALQIKFSDVILVKTIQLDAFNGLPGITITSFSAPSDNAELKRINIETTAAIPSPASLGVQLDMATFDLYFQGTNIGQASSNGLFLALKTTTMAPLSGYLRDESGDSTGLKNIGILFSQFLAGQNSTLSAHGNQVVTAANNNQPVKWLTAAFKRFSTPVILPGHIYQIIYSITLSDLSVTVDNPSDSYTLNPVGNNYTVAVFSNPFGFGLQPIQAAPHIAISYDGGDTAELDLPLLDVTAGTSRGPNDKQNLILMFKDQTLVGHDHANFQAFFKQLADMPSGTFGLKGSTDVVAKTVIGDPLITGIPFNVTTSLKGINSFDQQATISNASVDNPTTDYLGIHLVAGLNNPSNITLFTNQLSLPTIYKANNAYIGRATIPTLGLIPGQNNIDTLFELFIPDNSSAVQEVLQLYLQPSDLMTQGKFNQLPLQINGAANTNPPLSPYDSLEPALEGVVANTVLNGIGSAIVLQIRVYLSLQNVLELIASILSTAAGALLPPGILPANSTVYQEAYAYIDARNDIPSKLDIKQLSSTVFDYTNNEEIAIFTVNFDYILPAATSTGNPSAGGARVTSPKIPNILLTKGLIGSIPNVGHNLNVDNWIQVDLSANSGTFFIPGLHYIQDNIDTKYCIGDGNSDTCLFDISGLGTLTGLLNAILGNSQFLDQLLGLLGTLTSGTGGLVSLPGSLGALVCAAPALGAVLCPKSSSSTSANLTSVLSSAAAGVSSTASSVASQLTGAVGNPSSAVNSVANQASSAATAAEGDFTAGAATVSSVVTSVVGDVTSILPRAVAEPAPTLAARYPSINANQLGDMAKIAQNDPRDLEAFKNVLMMLAKKAEEDGLDEHGFAAKQDLLRRGFSGAEADRHMPAMRRAHRGDDL